ncbi:hypothetical protein IP88_06315 [alpha proteobacterium AAP81b]|nr:hypothetical protein IP88_06315 [alpha proteobacterium AAP81b]
MRSLKLIAAAALATVAIAAPASAVTFATFSAIGNGNNFRLNNSGNSGLRTTDVTFVTNTSGTTLAPVDVRFSFTQPGLGLSSFVNNVTASLSITGSAPKGSPVTPIGGSPTGPRTQPNLGGTFTFLSTAPITVQGQLFRTTTFAAGSNLLTATFSSATIAGTGGGNSATFAGTTVTYTSDFLDFENGSNSFTTTLANLTPGLAVTTNAALRAFRARIGGSFNAQYVPVASNAVPEPATWALLLTGFGLVGVAMRRRKTVVAA